MTQIEKIKERLNSDLAKLERSGYLKPDYTGAIGFELVMNQGGVRDSKLSLNPKL